MQDRDVFLLEIIIEFCDRILASFEKYGTNFEDFKNDLDYQDMCCMRAMQIGEYVNNLSGNFKEAHSEIPWHKIVGLRNFIAHDYGDIDVEVIWKTLVQDIRPLRDFCAKQIGAE